MANAYLTYMAVGSPQEASILANEHTWTILEVLRESGARGLTAPEVHVKVEKKVGGSVSPSKIYSLLKRLYQNEWVHRYYDKDAQAQRNTISYSWGGVFIDEEFGKQMDNKMSTYIKKELFPVFESYFEKCLDTLMKDKKSEKWIPGEGTSCYCKKCHVSHEAEEFFDAVLEIAAAQYLESDKFNTFLENYEFSEKED